MDTAQRPASRPRGAVGAVRVTAWFALASVLLAAPRSAVASAFTPCAVPRAECRVPGGSAPPRSRELQASASRIVSDTFWSQALGIRKAYVAYLPPSYEASPGRRYPVAYYLHGMWGNEWDWVRAGGLDHTLDSLISRGVPEMVVVMPDGDDSWYTTWNSLGNNAECRRSAPPGRQGESVDSYCVPWPHYDDYLARDLVARVDSTFRTVPSRSARAVAGLSMGGYGAVSLALSYPDVFSAAASHSGVLSPLYMGPHPFSPPPRYAATEGELSATVGRLWPSMRLAFGRDTTGWWPRDPGRRAATYGALHREPMPAVMLDAGVDDPYVDQSRDFHHTLQRLGVRHEYAEWPGKHDWTYWSARVGRSLTWIAKIIGQPSSSLDTRRGNAEPSPPVRLRRAPDRWPSPEVPMVKPRTPDVE